MDTSKAVLKEMCSDNKNKSGTLFLEPLIALTDSLTLTQTETISAYQVSTNVI